MKRLLTSLVTLGLVSAAFAADPNPPVQASPLGRSLIRQTTAAGMRTVIGVSSGGISNAVVIAGSGVSVTTNVIGTNVTFTISAAAGGSNVFPNTSPYTATLASNSLFAVGPQNGTSNLNISFGDLANNMPINTNLVQTVASNAVSVITTNVIYGINRIDVRQYGAYPDNPSIPANGGVAQAIHAAELLSSVTNPIAVFFPAGTYYFNETNAYPGYYSESSPNIIMVRSNGVWLVGPGARLIPSVNMSSNYNFLGIGGYVNFNTNRIYTTNNMVFGLEFDRSGYNNIGDLTQCYYNWDLTFFRCKFYDSELGYDGIDTQFGGLLTIRDCYFERIRDNAIGTQNSPVHIIGCVIRGGGYDATAGGAISLTGTENYISDTLIESTNWWDTVTSGTFDNCQFTSEQGEPNFTTNSFVGSGAQIYLRNCLLYSSDSTGGALIRVNSGGHLTMNNCKLSGPKPAIFMENPASMEIRSTIFENAGIVFWGGGWGDYLVEGCNFKTASAAGNRTISSSFAGLPLHNMRLVRNFDVGEILGGQAATILTNWTLSGNTFYPGADVLVDYPQGWEVSYNTGNSNTTFGTAFWGNTNRFTANRFGQLIASYNTALVSNWFFDNVFGAVSPNNLMVWTNAWRSNNRDWYGNGYDSQTNAGTVTAAAFVGNGAGLTGLPGGGDALTANPLSQFAATTSAQLAGVVSDETGNGPAVFNTDATLTGPTIQGTQTNHSASKLSGGIRHTNFATGSWIAETNGTITLGPTNAAATITLNGVTGDISSTTFGTTTLNVSGAVNGSASGLTNLLVSKLVSPTNAMANGVAVDFTVHETTTNANNAIALTTLTGLNATNYNWTIIHVLANGADRPVTPPAGFRKNFGTAVVTNGTVSDFFLELQFNQFSNIFKLDAY